MKKSLLGLMGTFGSVLAPVPVFAQTDEFTTTGSECLVNGEIVPCEEVAAAAGSIMLVIGIVSFISFIVWIVFLVKLIKSDAENKGLWIAISILFGAPGALVAYFAAVRPSRKAAMSMPPVPPAAPQNFSPAPANPYATDPTNSPSAAEPVMPSTPAVYPPVQQPSEVVMPQPEPTQPEPSMPIQPEPTPVTINPSTTPPAQTTQDPSSQPPEPPRIINQ